MVCLVVACLVLALRAGSERLRRALFVVTAAAVGLQALVEGARWQLAPAYGLTALGAALALRLGVGPLAGGKVRLVLRVGGWGLGLLLVVVLPALLPVPSFPAPEGPYPVGTLTFVLEDPTRDDAGAPGRPRRWLAQAFYPAEAGAAAAPRAPYAPGVKQTGPLLARIFRLPSFFLNHLVYASSHSHENAAFAPSVGQAPLLVMSHGYRFTRSVSTTTAEALASQGYVVIALEHTDDAAAVVFPDGSVAVSREADSRSLTEEQAEDAKTASIRVRAADVRFLLDRLSRGPGAALPGALAGHIDAARVGVFGHSLGGGTAAEVCRSDPRVSACANLDGLIYGEARAAGVAQPFLHVENEQREDMSSAFLGRLRGPSCRVRAARVAHFDFSDVPLILPILPYLMPRPGTKNAGGEATLRAMNQLVTAFFDATLRDQPAGWSRVASVGAPFSAVCERLPGR